MSGRNQFVSDGNSAWELSAPAAPQTQALRNDLQVDVLIIGAGYSGLSTALHLRDSGLDIAVIDAAGIAAGASGRNGGHVLPLIKKAPQTIIKELGRERGEALVRMVGNSADKVFSIIQEYAIDCDAEQNGWIQSAHSASAMRSTGRLCADWQGWQARMTLLDRDRHASMIGSDSYVGGMLVEAGGHINPLAYARELARVVMQQGVSLYTETPALSLQRQHGRWQVQTPAACISAEKIVLATAAYSERLWPGLDKSFLPFYLYCIATRPLEAALRATILPGRQPLTDTRGDAHVFHYDGDGRLMTGGTFILPYNWRQRLPARAARILRTTFPQLSAIDFETEHIWRGKVAMSADILPHMHILAPNLYSWLGCNARGIALSTSMGAVLAEAVKGLHKDDWQLQPQKLQAIPAHLLSRLMTAFVLGYYRLRDSMSQGEK